MAVAIRGYAFRAGLVPTLATALLLPLLVALGIWQMGRAEQKQALLDLYQGRADAAPVVLDGGQADLAALRFRRAMVTGRFDDANQILLDNRIHRGRAGYEVITPLRIAGSGIGVLVNRGWVPLGASRAQLPEAPAPAGRVTLHGVLAAPPAQGLDVGRRVAPDAAWPALLSIDTVWLEQRLGYRLLPYVVLLDPQESGGFVREWKLFDFGPERHWGYAFQWFALAAALVIIYITVNMRRVSADGGREGV